MQSINAGTLILCFVFGNVCMTMHSDAQRDASSLRLDHIALIRSFIYVR